MNSNKKLVIAYNFRAIKEIDNRYIPQPFIASTLDNTLHSFIKKAVPKVLEGFQIPYKDTPHQTLLELCDKISLIGLHKKYVVNNKNVNSLATLMADKKSKKVVFQFIDLQLLKIFKIFKEHACHLCCFSNKTALLKKFNIKFSTTSCEPHLYFKKKSDGIAYSLKLKINNAFITPLNKNIKIIYNTEGWFVLDNFIYKLENINAKKIKPFLNKENIFIPKRMELSFFKTFVLEISKKMEIKAEGFQVHHFQQLTECKLLIYHDFFLKEYSIQVQFWYDDDFFNYDEKNDTKTALTFVDNVIGIKKIKRDFKEEEKYIHLLVDAGLQQTNRLRFTIDQTKDSYRLIEFISEKQEFLKSKNIHIYPFEIDGKPISFHKKSLEFSVTEKIDWFDVYATIKYNHHVFNFIELKPYIKENNRFFPLPDNTFFIIPLEWMNRYKDLFNFGKTTKKELQLPKSNYPLLESLQIETSLSKNLKDNTTIEIPKELKDILRPYQKEGVLWLLNHYKNHLGACLADDMGLGKTLQTIAVLATVKKQKNLETQAQPKKNSELGLFSELEKNTDTPLCAFIIVPASLIFNWKDEFLKFTPNFTVRSYRGKERVHLRNKLTNFDVILTTYQTALKDVLFLKTIPFSYLILDESQYIKNNSSKIFKAINQLKADHKISLSGTMIENSLSDLWSQMEFANPSVLGNYSFFKKNYIIPIEKFQEEKTIKKLKNLIHPYILRRTKEEVAKDLPKLSEQIIYVEMLDEQKKLYQKEKSAIRNILLDIDSEKEKLFVMNILLRLRQLANHPILFNKANENIKSGKFLDATAYIETLVKAEKKVLVFSSFVSHLELYKTWCIENNITVNMLTGKTSIKEREELVKDFQTNSKTSLFLISLKAGGTGLNLTAASYVIILDPWWNPFSEKQAIGRAHRIGQKQHVSVLRFISKNSLEEKIMQMQHKKNEISNAIIDSDISEKLSLEDLKNLVLE